jgi:uncharacterized protein (DUF924 family)
MDVTTNDAITHKNIIDFWFAESTKKLWFNSTTEFDEYIRLKYQALWKQASEGQLESWQNTPLGALALVIILDQFPLNMFRGTAKSYATESHAIIISRAAISNNFDKELSVIQLPFLFMPLMHSEKLDDQNYSVYLFEQAKLDNNIRYAKHHRNIIERYGRFPHRNDILGRTNTAKELEYLTSPQAFKG